VPVIVGSNEEALNAAEFLQRKDSRCERFVRRRCRQEKRDCDSR